jgi:hypothetical protein
VNNDEYAWISLRRSFFFALSFKTLKWLIENGPTCILSRSNITVLKSMETGLDPNTACALRFGGYQYSLNVP